MPKAKTMSDAADKYNRKVDTMASRWAGKKPVMKTEWPKGINRFYGVTPGPTSTANYNAGLDAVSPEGFRDRVKGKGEDVMAKAKAGLAL